MKIIKKAFLVLAILSGFSNVTLYAADLVNSDNVSYTIFVDTDDGSKTITIAPNETISEICSDCYLEIDGNPKGVTIENEPIVTIKDGKLSVASNE
ncbi:MAG: hypothetical protein KDF58_08835 [Alphaproteobacteria bacterium]|nr:hypothetical protein [Alphaproteobacteria bacterium]HPF45906.1 hypothetical protein [Emcibacteraceae bacterium]HRW28895.1 hypothetical protein [Emcibacteraceae bacterium]